MASSIQPPGGSGPPDGPKGPEGKFAEAVEHASVEGNEALSQGGAVTDAPQISQDASAAAEQLIAQALQSDMAQALSEEGRQELAGFLAETMAEDPNLQALIAKLGAE